MSVNADATPVGPVISTARRGGHLVLDVLWLPVVAVVLVRVAGLERGFPWVALMTAFPYLAFVAGGLFVVSLLAWHRRGLAVGGLVLLALAALLGPRALPGPTPAVAPEGPVVTIATTNLFYGRADTDAILAALEAHEVDLLTVVELTEPALDGLRSSGLDDRLGASTLRTARGAAGSGIWSRWPIQVVRESVMNRGFAMPTVAVSVPGAVPVELTAVHPWPPVEAHVMDRWEEALDALPRPEPDVVQVLAGDFNASLDHAHLRRLLHDGYVDAADATGDGLTPTYTGIDVPVPSITIDHVLVDPRVAVLAVEIVDVPRSDHRMVVARVRLPAA